MVRGLERGLDARHLPQKRVLACLQLLWAPCPRPIPEDVELAPHHRVILCLASDLAQVLGLTGSGFTGLRRFWGLGLFGVGFSRSVLVFGF